MGWVFNIVNLVLEMDYIVLKENFLNGNLYLLVCFILSIYLDLFEIGIYILVVIVLNLIKYL